MLFGLTNALASFQRFINTFLAEKLNIYVIVYVDDIFIYIDDNRDGHVAAIWWILKQLRKFFLYANLKKCQFYQNGVRFLGYGLSLKSICMKDKRIEAVK